MEVLTRDDVIRAGACGEGVAAFAAEHFPDATAAPVAMALRACADDEQRGWILKAAELDGYGYGGGYGWGYGDGGGYGDGDGDGDGDGGEVTDAD